MSLIKTNGSLYFLRDKDYLTGKIGPYVKIGIVRKDKTTEQRIQEHQTGNPRDIIDVHTIQGVPFVEKLETLMHYRFNEKWITGEWFILNDHELNIVIAEADRMKSEQLRFEQDILKEEKLSNVMSNGIKRTALPNEIILRDDYINKLKRVKELEVHLALVRAEFCKALGKKYGKINGVLDMSFTTDSLSFDSTSFINAHPAIYDSYCTNLTEVKIKKSFSIQGKSQANLTNWNKSLANQYKAIPDEIFIRAQENNELKRTKKVEALHYKHLCYLKELTLLNWDLELIEFQLKSAIDLHEEIIDVCTWKRELVTASSKKFDLEKFKKEQPALYLAHYVVKQGYHKINIYGHRAYKPR
jgi:tetrahydromethanopterin S-methyltransferase subunit G